MLTWKGQHSWGRKTCRATRRRKKSKQRQLGMQRKQLAHSYEQGGAKDFRKMLLPEEKQPYLEEAAKLLRPEDVSSVTTMADVLAKRTNIEVDFDSSRDIEALRSVSQAMMDMSAKYSKVSVEPFTSASPCFTRAPMRIFILVSVRSG